MIGFINTETSAGRGTTEGMGVLILPLGDAADHHTRSLFMPAISRSQNE
jgi:hypothetical protein